MTLNLRDAADAMRMVSDENIGYYNRADGTFQWYGPYEREEEEQEDEEDLVPLPSRYDINDYHIMEEFIDSLEDGQAKEWLGNSIRGRGAFRRFRGTCERFGLLDDWYAFQDEYYLNLARDWCDANNIPYENREEEMDDDDNADFDWNDEEQFRPREEVQKEVKVQKDPFRIVEMSERNMNLLSYLTDAYDRLMEEEREEHTDEMIGEDQFVYAVSDNGRFIAYVYGKYIEDTAVVKEMYVRKEYRHKGVGRSLLDHVRQENEKTAVRMERQNDSVKAFLKACGYGRIKAVEYTVE